MKGIIRCLLSRLPSSPNVTAQAESKGSSKDPFERKLDTNAEAKVNITAIQLHECLHAQFATSSLIDEVEALNAGPHTAASLLSEEVISPMHLCTMPHTNVLQDQAFHTTSPPTPSALEIATNSSRLEVERKELGELLMRVIDPAFGAVNCR